MKELEEKYKNAIDKIGAAKLLELPETVKEVLKSTTDLETKTKMLEAITNNCCLKKVPCCGCAKFETCEKSKIFK